MATLARRVLVIGGSAGGLQPLTHVIGELPHDLPAAVLAVLHFPPLARTRLPLILDRAGPLRTGVAHDGEPLVEGRVYLPAPDRHMVVGHGRVRLSGAPRENGHRPAIDPLFRSAARSYGEAATGVVLCGMLDDGSAGLLSIRRAGGGTVVLDPASCEFPDMPRNAVDQADPEHVVPLEDIPRLLVELARRDALPDRRSPAATEEADPMPHLDRELWGDDRPGRPSGFSCPECHGVLWEMDPAAGAPRFECRIGHRISAESLLELRFEELEGALWASVRALEEQASLAHRLAERARERGNGLSAQRFRRRGEEASQQADLVRTLALRPRVDSDGTTDAEAAAAAGGC